MNEKSDKWQAKVQPGAKNEKLIPVVVQDVRTKDVLMLAYADAAALENTKRSKTAWFYSRSRKKLWKKGGTSGNTMRVRNIQWDCDADAVLYQVEPRGQACHSGADTCFGPKAFSLGTLEKIIASKKGMRGSYTATLLDQPWLLAEKLCEEGAELAESRTKKQTVWEAADVLYFLLVKLAQRNVALVDVVKELARRNASDNKKTRRKAVR